MQRMEGTVLKDSMLFLIQIWNLKIFLSFQGKTIYVVVNANILFKFYLSYP